METYSLSAPVRELVLLGVLNEILHCLLLGGIMVLALQVWANVSALGPQMGLLLRGLGATVVHFGGVHFCSSVHRGLCHVLFTYLGLA